MSKSHEQQLKWRDTEVEELIASMKERELLALSDGKKRRSLDVFAVVRNDLLRKGYFRTEEQIRRKMNELRKQYFEANRSEPDSRYELCDHYEALHDLFTDAQRKLDRRSDRSRIRTKRRRQSQNGGQQEVVVPSAYPMKSSKASVRRSASGSSSVCSSVHSQQHNGYEQHNHHTASSSQQQNGGDAMHNGGRRNTSPPVRLKRPDKFHLKQSAYQPNLNNSLTNLCKNDRYADVMLLVCNDDDNIAIPAHRLVLGTFSPYFANVFEKVAFVPSSATIYVALPPTVTRAALQCLLQYMYTGEAIVHADSFDDVMMCGEFLRINGFAGKRSSGMLKGQQEELVSVPLVTVTKTINMDAGDARRGSPATPAPANTTTRASTPTPVPMTMRAYYGSPSPPRKMARHYEPAPPAVFQQPRYTLAHQPKQDLQSMQQQQQSLRQPMYQEDMLEPTALMSHRSQMLPQRQTQYVQQQQQQQQQLQQYQPQEMSDGLFQQPFRQQQPLMMPLRQPLQQRYHPQQLQPLDMNLGQEDMLLPSQPAQSQRQQQMMRMQLQRQWQQLQAQAQQLQDELMDPGQDLQPPLVRQPPTLQQTIQKQQSLQSLPEQQSVQQQPRQLETQQQQQQKEVQQQQTVPIQQQTPLEPPELPLPQQPQCPPVAQAQQPAAPPQPPAQQKQPQVVPTGQQSLDAVQDDFQQPEELLATLQLVRTQPILKPTVAQPTQPVVAAEQVLLPQQPASERHEDVATEELMDGTEVLLEEEEILEPEQQQQQQQRQQPEQLLEQCLSQQPKIQDELMKLQELLPSQELLAPQRPPQLEQPAQQHETLRPQPTLQQRLLQKQKLQNELVRPQELLASQELLAPAKTKPTPQQQQPQRAAAGQSNQLKPLLQFRRPKQHFQAQILVDKLMAKPTQAETVPVAKTQSQPDEKGAKEGKAVPAAQTSKSVPSSSGTSQLSDSVLIIKDEVAAAIDKAVQENEPEDPNDRSLEDPNDRSLTRSECDVEFLDKPRRNSLFEFADQRNLKLYEAQERRKMDFIKEYEEHMKSAQPMVETPEPSPSVPAPPVSPGSSSSSPPPLPTKFKVQHRKPASIRRLVALPKPPDIIDALDSMVNLTSDESMIELVSKSPESQTSHFSTRSHSPDGQGKIDALILENFAEHPAIFANSSMNELVPHPETAELDESDGLDQQEGTLPDQYVSSRLNCQLCYMSFTTPTDWVNHVSCHCIVDQGLLKRRRISNDDDSDYFRCDMCSSYFISAQDWLTHVAKHNHDHE
ncbi:daxx-like protein [Anopheles merus]|uniref:daxx-like protein n=1 Tax=Anopheles merus TaxID=30066 RepID=UPI001BE4075E|nr:daxx-like protein [Anopheles merus]